jgi:hypothetical protein
LLFAEYKEYKWIVGPFWKNIMEVFVDKCWKTEKERFSNVLKKCTEDDEFK